MPDMNITGHFFPTESKKQSKGKNSVNIPKTNVRFMSA